MFDRVKYKKDKPAFWKMVLANFIDFAILIGFIIVSNMLLNNLYDHLYEVPPPAPMQLFNENQARAYAHSLLLSLVLIFINSFLLNITSMQGSIGKYIMRIALVNKYGGHIKTSQAFYRFAILALYVALICCPGPILGFIRAPEYYSFIALALGIIIVIYLAVIKKMHYSAPEIYIINKKKKN